MQNKNAEKGIKIGFATNSVRRYLAEALTERKHNEFHSVQKNVHLDEEQVRTDLMRLYRLDHTEDVDRIITSIKELMPT